ncbi:hypothetical protein [Chondrinema litorale]|uniref:hypothetical protein n=1 Tax=Chondrinema litorale TaxID=2994555 RepID=UPI002543304F|nr:hypothetical protein [Chondrinema litorale]UZR96121.1 hypothetical protein OQ292_09910 [Chondrinema litorale]
MNKPVITLFLVYITSVFSIQAQNIPSGPEFNVLVLEENRGHHLEYTQRAKIWLDSLSSAHHFTIKYIQHTDLITAQFLEQFELIIQLDFPPYTWTDAQKSAFETYIDQGKRRLAWLPPCNFIRRIRWLLNVAMVFRFYGRYPI